MASSEPPDARTIGRARFAVLSFCELSPIEHCWSKLKTPLCTAEPRSIAAIEEQIAPALDTITPEDAQV